MSAWSVKTRRAPSRHFTNARVYGHTTTATHDMSTPLYRLPVPTFIAYDRSMHRSSSANLFNGLPSGTLYLLK